MHFSALLFITLDTMCTTGIIFSGKDGVNPAWSVKHYICSSLLESTEVQDIVYNRYIQGKNLQLPSTGKVTIQDKN